MADDKIPPQAPQAEAAVLGAMLLEQEAVAKALELLTEQSFYAPAHRQVFRAIADLFARNVPSDLLTVGEELRRRKELDGVGGSAYLAELVAGVVSTAHIEEHARLVLEKATQRQLIATATQILSESYDSALPADNLLDRAEHLIFQIKEAGVRRGLARLKDLLTPVVKEITDLHEKGGKRLVTGLETGFNDLDERTSGLQKGDMVIVAGRPSVGKTAFALDLAMHVALRQQLPVAIFSLEMSRDILIQRLLCSEASINLQNLRRGRLARADWTRLTAALGPLSTAPLYIDDSAALSVLEIRAKARRLRAEVPLAMVLIDYLQLIEAPRGERGQKNRQQEISDISRSLKAMAKELDLPVVTISQLSRMPERRDDRRPQLADLRESGAIEQDADLVLLLYREALYKHDLPPEEQNITELNIAKQRNGPVGTFKLVFLGEFMRFENAALQMVAPEAEEA